MSARNTPRREVRATVFDAPEEEQATPEASVHLVSYYKTLQTKTPTQAAGTAVEPAVDALGNSVLSSRGGGDRGTEEPTLPNWNAGAGRSPNVSGMSNASSTAGMLQAGDIPAIPQRDASHRDSSHDNWQQGITSPRRTAQDSSQQGSGRGSQPRRPPTSTAATAGHLDSSVHLTASGRKVLRHARSPTKPPTALDPDKTNLSALSGICDCSSISSGQAGIERQLFPDDEDRQTIPESLPSKPKLVFSGFGAHTVERCDRHGSVLHGPQHREACRTPSRQQRPEADFCTPNSNPHRAEEEAERRVEEAAKRVFLLVCQLQIAFRESFGTDPPAPQPVTAIDWREAIEAARGTVPGSGSGRVSARQHQDPLGVDGAAPSPQRSLERLLEQLEVKEEELTRVVVQLVQRLSLQVLRDINRGRFSPAWEVLQLLEAYTKPEAGIYLKDSAVMPKGGVVYILYFPSPQADQSERRRVRAVVENNRGLYHFKLEEYQLAREHLQFAVELEVALNVPTIGVTFFNLAQAERECRGCDEESFRHLALAEDAVEQRVYSNKCVLNQLQHGPLTTAAGPAVPPSRLADLAMGEGERHGLTEEQLEVVQVWLQWREAVCLLSYLKQEHGNWLAAAGQFKKAAAQFDQAIRWLTTISRLSPEEVQRLEVLRRSVAECRKAMRAQQRRPPSAAQRPPARRSKSAAAPQKTVVTTVLPRHIEVIDASLAGQALRRSPASAAAAPPGGGKGRRLDHHEDSETSWIEEVTHTGGGSRGLSAASRPSQGPRGHSVSSFCSHSQQRRSRSRPRMESKAVQKDPLPAEVAGTAPGGLSALQRQRWREQQREQRLRGSRLAPLEAQEAKQTAAVGASSSAAAGAPLSSHGLHEVPTTRQVNAPYSSAEGPFSSDIHHRTPHPSPQDETNATAFSSSTPTPTTTTTATTTDSCTITAMDPDSAAAVGPVFPPNPREKAATEGEGSQSWRAYHAAGVQAMGFSPLPSPSRVRPQGSGPVGPAKSRGRREKPRSTDAAAAPPSRPGGRAASLPMGRAPTSFIQAITLLQSTLRWRGSCVQVLMRCVQQANGASSLSLSSGTGDGSGRSSSQEPQGGAANGEAAQEGLAGRYTRKLSVVRVIDHGEEFSSTPLEPAATEPSKKEEEGQEELEYMLDGTQKPSRTSYGEVLVKMAEVLEAESGRTGCAVVQSSSSSSSSSAAPSSALEPLMPSIPPPPPCGATEKTHRPDFSKFPSSCAHSDEADSDNSASHLPCTTDPFLTATPAPSYQYSIEESNEPADDATTPAAAATREGSEMPRQHPSLAQEGGETQTAEEGEEKAEEEGPGSVMEPGSASPSPPPSEVAEGLPTTDEKDASEPTEVRHGSAAQDVDPGEIPQRISVLCEEIGRRLDHLLAQGTRSRSSSPQDDAQEEKEAAEARVSTAMVSPSTASSITPEADALDKGDATDPTSKSPHREAAASAADATAPPLKAELEGVEKGAALTVRRRSTTTIVSATVTEDITVMSPPGSARAPTSSGSPVRPAAAAQDSPAAEQGGKEPSSGTDAPATPTPTPAASGSPAVGSHRLATTSVYYRPGSPDAVPPAPRPPPHPTAQELRLMSIVKPTVEWPSTDAVHPPRSSSEPDPHEAHRGRDKAFFFTEANHFPGVGRDYIKRKKVFRFVSPNPTSEVCSSSSVAESVAGHSRSPTTPYLDGTPSPKAPLPSHPPPPSAPTGSFAFTGIPTKVSAVSGRGGEAAPALPTTNARASSSSPSRGTGSADSSDSHQLVSSTGTASTHPSNPGEHTLPFE